jgi:hypothetical protein
MTNRSPRQWLGPALGLAGALTCTATLVVTVAIGLPSQELLLIPTFVVTGLLGALVASRAPTNPVGWLMGAASLAANLFFVPVDYGYTAKAGLALWVGAWAWIPVLALFLPALTVRFPDGRVPPRWWAVDWLAVAGAAAASLGVALSPPDVLVRFWLLPRSALAPATTLVNNPTLGYVPSGLAALLTVGGLVLMALAYLGASASVVDRFRSAQGDERLQLKWFTYACGLIAATVVLGVAVDFSGQPIADAGGVVYHVLFAALPLGIAVAILRYRLYDIDLLINRTVVYLSLTAILGALYAAAVTFLNRLFVSISGQKSDSAYVLTAFLVVVAFSPIKDWLQRRVDRRLGGAHASAALDRFSADVDAVVSVMDVDRIACRLVDQAVIAFDARGAALYLESTDGATPFYSRGNANGDAAVEVQLRHEGRNLGRLVMGTRRGDLAYSNRDRDALQRSADSVGAAVALAVHFGHRPPAVTTSR